MSFPLLLSRYRSLEKVGRVVPLQYWQMVYNTQTANLSGYWMLDEQSGTIAIDSSGNGNNGSYASITLGQPGIGDGKTGIYFDGVANGSVNLFSAGLASLFNGSEGTFSIWIKGYSSAFWRDGTYHRIAKFYGDAQNYWSISKRNIADVCAFYEAGDILDTPFSYPMGQNPGWTHVAVRWSATDDTVGVYLNGILMYNASTVLGTWS